MKKEPDENQTYFYRAAHILSRVFDIYVTFTLIILITTFRAKGNLAEIFLWGGVFLILLVIAPTLTDLYFVSKKTFTDWDISDRKQRIKFVEMGAFLLIGLTLASYLFHAPRLFTATALILAIDQIIHAQVTRYWKISFHAQMITLFCVYAAVFLGGNFWLFLLFIPLICISRVYLKKHTPAQVIWGTIVALLVSFGVLYIFQYF